MEFRSLGLPAVDMSGVLFHILMMRWATNEDGSLTTALYTDSIDQGYLSARHSGKVLSGQLDGSIELLTLEALADMRRWSTNTDAPDWVPSITP
jgi:hypothetical protein